MSTLTRLIGREVAGSEDYSGRLVHFCINEMYGLGVGSGRVLHHHFVMSKGHAPAHRYPFRYAATVQSD